MIPRTFPSSVASNGSRQMIVYFLPSVSGLTRWVDYIPVKFTTVATAATENTYNQNGYIPVVSLSSIAGATPFKEYVPVFLDSSAADADVWDVTITGFIPVGTAGIGGAALYLDFAATTTLDPRITFSRTTNATVTGSNGLIQNAPMNLLTFSEQFDNAAWGKSGSTVTANATAAPDGTTTADKLVEDTSTAEHRLRVVTIAKPVNAVMTYAVYVKPAGRYFVLSMEQGGLGLYTNFDVSTNQYWDYAADTGWVRGQTVIADVGNGWYRCSISGTTDANTSMNVRVTLSNVDGTQKNPTYTGNGTSGVFLWGAQLELGSTATTYNPTTVKNLLGFTENFDNAAWTKSNAFVQTNLEKYSQQFSNAFWDKAGGLVVVTDNYTTAPDGSMTATLMTEAAGTGSHHIHDATGTWTPVIGVAYTMSTYLKRPPVNGDRYAQMTFWLAGFAATAYANFDLQLGTVAFQGAGLTSATITDAGNGWYRLAITSTATATGASGWQLAFISSGTAARAENYTVTAGNEESYYLWGAQVVQGTSAGDYKATYAAAAAVGYTDIYGQPFAQKLVASTASSTHFTSGDATVVSGTKYTASIYVKAAEYSTAIIGFLASTGFSTTTSVLVNLAEGTVSTGTGTPLSSAIANVGNGWYRVSVVLAATASGTGSIYIAAVNGTTYADRTVAGNGTSGIYIFGAQLSDSASVDPYVYQPVAAPTSTAYYGPRFDYDASTATFTEVLGNDINSLAAWSGTSYFTYTAPNLFISNTSGSTQYPQRTFLTSGRPYVVSVTCSAVSGTIKFANQGGLIVSPALTVGTTTALIVATDANLVWIVNNNSSATITSFTVKEYIGTTSTGATPKGLLIEEQRTNLVLRSQAFTVSPWSSYLSTTVANAAVAPDGTTTATSMVVTGQYGNISQTVTVSAGTSYTYSCYVRVPTGSTALIMQSFDGTSYTNVSLNVGSTWTRVTRTVTTGAAATTLTLQIIDNSASGWGGVQLWGAQLEAGAFATSYIPTVASQVTRAADSASMIGNNFARWYTQGPGTVYAEFLLNSTASTFPSAYSINDGTTNNRIQPYQNSALTSIGFDITTGGAAQAAINITAPNLTTAYVRHAGAYQTNSANAAANGTLGTEDTSVTLATYTRLGLGSNALAQNANCWIKRFTYYNRKLSPTEEQGITA